MSYILKIYCTACNSPKGSRQVKYSPSTEDIARGMPKVATAGYTVAVHSNLYNVNKGRRIELYIKDENGKVIASHQPFIMDIHGNTSDVIDFYIGEREECDCRNHPWSNKTCEFKFLD